MLFALLLAQAATPPVVTLPPAPPPADLASLPILALTRRSPANDVPSEFVREEVAAGRCVAARRDAATGGTGLSVELAVLIDGDGQVRRIVPRAIDCPTVEQYASGLASRMIRQNLAPGAPGGWYRTTIAFAW